MNYSFANCLIPETLMLTTEAPIFLASSGETFESLIIAAAVGSLVINSTAKLVSSMTSI